eukprot:TRINITY_DN11982_c0_g1_i1.p2 TRINITY_DN11982_c0_g1~~TRINITY_DN11982_c0_g1_i1.p2  ORF type:complete len:590 (+),score=139.88 TRINITY_DN11982_c0_g1_i1:88-1770(+)
MPRPSAPALAAALALVCGLLAAVGRQLGPRPAERPQDAAAEGIPQDLLAAARAAFSRLDRDGDSRLSMAEFARLYYTRPPQAAVAARPLQVQEKESAPPSQGARGGPKPAPDFAPPRPPRTEHLHAHLYPDIDVASVIGPLLPLHLRISIAVFGRRRKTEACLTAQLSQWRRYCVAGVDLRVSVHVTDSWADRAAHLREAELFCQERSAGSLAISLVQASPKLRHDFIHQYRRVWRADSAEGWAHWYLFHEEDGGITLEHVAVLIKGHRDFAGPAFWPLLLRVEPWMREGGRVESGLTDAQMQFGKVDCAIAGLWWPSNTSGPALMVPCMRFSAYTFVDAAFVRRAAARTAPPFVPPDTLCSAGGNRTSDGWGDSLGHTCREQISQFWPPWGWWGGDWTGAATPKGAVPLSQWRNYLVVHLDPKVTREGTFEAAQWSIGEHISMEDVVRCLTPKKPIYHGSLRERGLCHADYPIRPSYPEMDQQDAVWRTVPPELQPCPGSDGGGGRALCRLAHFFMLRVEHHDYRTEKMRCECVWNNAKQRTKTFRSRPGKLGGWRKRR